MNASHYSGPSSIDTYCRTLGVDHIVIPKVQYIKINGVKVVCYSDSGQALADYKHIKSMFPDKKIELVGESL